MDAKKIFTEYYKKNAWRSNETRSGFGSELKSTRPIIREIPILLKDLGINTLLDASCGDFNWMKHVDLSNVNYTGVDIVDDLISQNNALYASSGKRFLVADIIVDNLPKVDLILCRDCLFHLPNTVMAFLN